MKRILFTLSITLCCLISSAQVMYPNDTIYDYSTITFAGNDSLIWHAEHVPYYYPTYTIMTIDTAGTDLWKIGSTLKPVFSNTVTPAKGIMTDTMNTYPKNADDYFVLKAKDLPPNFIINVWHRYDMDSFHAGGIVEFSTDTGATWMNVINCAATENFYSSTDTLFNGVAAFTGKSNGEVFSRIQFITCIGEKSSATSCFRYQQIALVYFRFRFVSDTTTDSLSGWMIDSIQLQNPGCIPGAVEKLTKANALTIYPNPATDKITISSSVKINQIVISNLVGQTVYNHEYSSKQVHVNVAGFAKGVYLIKVNGTEVRRFVKE